MATNSPELIITGVAGSDLSAAQYKFVKLATDGEFDVATDGVQAEGVLQNDPIAGKAASIATAGICKVLVGTGGITAGDAIASSATGAAITAATADAKIAVALDTAAAGEYARVLLGKSGADVA